MKWLNRLAALLFGLISIREVKQFLNKYEIVIFDKDDILTEGEPNVDITGLRPENYDNAIDLRGTPTHQCVCGSNIWNIKAIFENFEIATYFIDMECANCGSLATAPTPVDREKME